MRSSTLALWGVAWPELRARAARFGQVGPAGLCLVSLCLLLVGVDVVRSLHERDVVLDAASRETMDLARSLGQQAEATVSATDAVLAGLSERIETDGLGPAALARLQKVSAARRAALPWVLALSAYDEAGGPILSDGVAIPPDRLMREAIFTGHRDQPDRGLHIGAPFRASGRWIVPLTRRLQHPGGEFAGIVMAALDVEWLQGLYGGFGIGASDAIELLAADGSLVLRRPFLEDKVGQVICPLPSFGPTSQGATFTARSPFDGIERVVSYRPLLGGKLVTLVALDRDHVLSVWRSGATRHLLGVMALCWLIAVLAIRLASLVRSRTVAELEAASLGEEHRMVAEHGSDMLLKIEPGGRRVYVSGACRRLLGYEPEEMLGIASDDALHPDDRHQHATIWGADATERPYTYRMRRKDGSYRWLEATLTRLPQRPGEPPQMLVVARDIDRRMRAETELRESEERYRLLAEHASDMIFRLDMEFRSRFVSPASCEILGYTPAELLGERPIDMIHPDDAEYVSLTYAALGAGQRRARLTNRVRHRDGHYVWVEALLRLLRDPQGKPTGIVGVMRDVSARHAADAREAEAMAKLEAANKLLLRAEAMTHLGHWRLDLQMQEVTWSEEVYRIHGRPLSEPPTLEAGIDAYHPDDRATVVQKVERAISHGEPFAFDLRIIRPSGEVRHVSAQGEPVRGATGDIVALVGIFQDVTDRVLLERELRQSQKMETIGRLAAGVAHDFNNLLQGILGGLELLRDEVDAGSQAGEYARIAMNSARRGADMTHHLLSYAGRQVLQPRLLDPASVLAELGPLIGRTLGPGVELRLHCPASAPSVEVDPAHLQTALLNLAMNAGQAMPDGGRLTVELRLEDGNAGQEVVIAMADTGEGMEAATVAQAFDPFFTTRGLAGTGLGLSMVQGFARQSGGDVRLESAPGRGTRIELRLPAARRAPAPPAHVSLRSVAGCRVLLVDDVSDVLVTTAAFLESSGIEVAAVASGHEALAVLDRGERVDALLTDYAMAEMDGVALIRAARERRPDLPCIVMTGFAGVSGAVLNDGVEVLHKPFQRRLLLEAVGRANGQGPPEPVVQAEAAVSEV